MCFKRYQISLLRVMMVVVMAKKRKQDKPSKAAVIIPQNHPNPPAKHEEDAAWILAHHYDCIIEFLIPVDDYKRKTPDAVMLGILTEFKSPTGNSKDSTVREQFERASRQGAVWLVFDAQRTKLADDFLRKEILKELAHRKRIKKVIFIDKAKNVIEISRET
jgi:hypothetical protein